MGAGPEPRPQDAVGQGYYLNGKITRESIIPDYSERTYRIVRHGFKASGRMPNPSNLTAHNPTRQVLMAGIRWFSA